MAREKTYACAIADVFDRGSDAGRILYNLYGGASTAKQAGNDFNRRNMREQSDRQRDGASTREPSERAENVKAARVAVPRPTGAASYVSMDAPRAGRPPPMWSGKKGGAQIEQELEALKEELRTAPPPVPRRPLLDEKEKDRLSRINEFGRGNVPENLPSAMGFQSKLPRGAPRSKQRSALEEFETRFDEVIQEIAERKEHLEEMGQLGATGKKVEDLRVQLQAEIAERVKQLRRLDNRIQELRAPPPQEEGTRGGDTGRGRAAAAGGGFVGGGGGR